MGNQLCCVDRKGDYDGTIQPNLDIQNDLPIFTIIKFQAIARGFIARNRVKKIYGFSRSPGMVN